ncbi:MAG: SDR family oxidoreductase [Myxococcaceae bacterium]
MSARVVLITGASSGMGKVAADLLHARGWKVYGTSRTVEALSPKPAWVAVNVDVTDDAAVRSVLARIEKDEGRLDAVVNCAGYVLAGAVEECSLEQLRAQLDTNYCGVANVCRLALPLMRKQGHGHLVNVSSLAAVIPMAFQAHYSASKAALTAFTRALRLEVAPFGVRAVSIEPGDFSTGVTAARKFGRTPEESAYPALARTMKIVHRDETGASPPDEVARLIARVLDTRKPAASYFVGQVGQTLPAKLRAFLPGWLFDWVLTKLYDL